MNRRTFLRVACAATALREAAPRANAAVPTAIPWTQWGGPTRNFQTESSGLKERWAASGPPVLWKRALGDGYSSPLVEEGVLYTMYGRPREEIVLAAEAATGKTLWEHATPMTFASDAPEMGNGPYSTPMIAGNRVFTTGVAGRLQCLDKKTGKPLWTQQLWEEHRGTPMMYGYASSAIAYRDLVIVPVGGPGKSLMAFRQADGGVAWAKNDFGNVYSSPLLIDVDGAEQLAALMDGAVIGVEPQSGRLLWQAPFKAQYSIAVATPVWGAGNLLFVSSEYDGGAKVIELKRKGPETVATEVWSSNRLRLHHGNAMRIGDSLYFTSGGKGSPAILSAVHARTGEIHWQERSIGKATFVWADRKLITLDQDGNLMIAHPSPEKFEIVAKASLLTRLSWTPPVLVGTKLYLRDRKTMMAVELG